MHKYKLIAKTGEGTFSEVIKAQFIKTGRMAAIKCMKSHFESEDQVNNLREIQALRRLSPNPNIVKLLEVLYDQPTGRLALVFELMEMNIYELIRGRRQYLPEARVRHLMYQLVKAMDHMHRQGIFHRDIKPENILVSNDELKLADFGSCRGIYSKQPYTEYISTRWYRAPECLLTNGYYNYKMDMWGVGCVFFEVVSMYPLFPGTNEADQIQKIHNIMGTPSADLLDKFRAHAAHIDLNFAPKEGTGIAKLLPHASSDCIDLICKLLEYNPEQRITARQALRHNYFKELRAAEKKQRKAAEALAAAAMQAPATLPPPVQEQSSQQNLHGASSRRAPAIVAPVSTKVSMSKRFNPTSSSSLPSVGIGASASTGAHAESLLPSVQGGALLRAGAGVQPSKTNLHGASSKWHSQHEVLPPACDPHALCRRLAQHHHPLFICHTPPLIAARIYSLPAGRRQELPLRLHLRVCRPRGGQRVRSKGQLERPRHKAQVRAAGLASGAARALRFRGVAVARGRRSILSGWRFEAAVICERRCRRWRSRRGQHDRQLCAPSL
jgi:renal tumor antigen